VGHFTHSIIAVLPEYGLRALVLLLFNSYHMAAEKLTLSFEERLAACVSRYYVLHAKIHFPVIHCCDRLSMLLYQVFAGIKLV
jgi:hypothetical protein